MAEVNDEERKIDMIGIVIVTHGKFSTELLKSAELIIGKQEHIATLGLDHGDCVHQLQESVSEIIEDLDDGDGVLVLTDLFGGSPTNVTAASMRYLQFQCITGVNLPMLLEVLCSRGSCTLDELVNLAYKAGIDGIKNIGDILNEKAQ